MIWVCTSLFSPQVLSDRGHIEHIKFALKFALKLAQTQLFASLSRKVNRGPIIRSEVDSSLYPSSFLDRPLIRSPDALASVPPCT